MSHLVFLAALGLSACGDEPPPEARGARADLYPAPGTGISASLPSGWRGAETLPAGPDLPEIEWQQGGADALPFKGRQVFAAATYDPGSAATGRGCMGGGPVLDAMPGGDAYVEILEQRDPTAGEIAAVSPKPKQFDYATAVPVLHECFGKSFEFGPFVSAGRALLARIFIRVDPGTVMSNGLTPTSRADREQAKKVLESIRVAGQR